MKTLNPRYDAADAEIKECRKKGLAYVANCPISLIVITADDARRRGETVSAIALESAAQAVARAQAVAVVAARRGHIRTKPKPVRQRHG